MNRKIYLDVSCLVNDYLLDYIENTKTTFCISELTLLELKSYELYNKNFKKKKIDNVLKNIEVLKVNEKILRLAKAYTKFDCISKEEYNDAIHIAIAKYYKCSAIIYDKIALEEKKINYNRMKCEKSSFV